MNEMVKATGCQIMRLLDEAAKNWHETRQQPVRLSGEGPVGCVFFAGWSSAPSRSGSMQAGFVRFGERYSWGTHVLGHQE